MSSTTSTPTASGSKYLPPILDDEVIRSINKTASDTVVNKVFSLVLNWGCLKDGSQSYSDFLKSKTTTNKWNKYYDKLSDRERINLDEIDSSSFDVSYMFILIPKVCPGLAVSGSTVWLEENESKLEYLLTIAKNLRNAIFHDPSGSALSISILSDITKVSEKIVRKAGEMYRSSEPQDVPKEIDNFSKMIDEIRMSGMTKAEIKRKEIGDKICTEAKKDLEETVRKEEADTIPFSQDRVLRRDVFYPIKLSIKDEERKNKIQIPCENLLKYFNNSYIIVTGMPGSGKSTLLKMIREDFVKPKHFLRLYLYELLLYMECRDATEDTIGQFLKKNFPNAMDCVSDEAEAVYSLRKYKTLICVDGLDEMTYQSNKLLNDLIDMFGTYGNASFLLTARFGASKTLKGNLGSKGLIYLDASIEPLYYEEEQVRFLKRYQLNISGMTNCSKLVRSFRALGVPCRRCMIHPVYLSLFCHLFKRSPDAVGRLESEWDIMELILKHSKDSMDERLLEEGVTDEKERRDLVSKLVAELCNLSVRQLLEDSLTIDERTYRNLCQYVFGEHDVSLHRVLSCILVDQANKRFFEYLHKSNAEFLAANSILTRLDNGDVHSILGYIYEASEEYTAAIQDFKDRQQRSPAAEAAAKTHTKTEASTVTPNEEDLKTGARWG